ncbi:unnamed protein product [Rhizophagus irregularis]|nr:unnamed protein product [Rhizophagus irregularis]
MIAPRVHAQILGVEILYQFSWLYQALLFYHINTLFRILSSLPQCNQGDQKYDFDTSNGNNIDLTEFDEPSEKSESSLNLIIKPSTGSASQSK